MRSRCAAMASAGLHRCREDDGAGSLAARLDVFGEAGQLEQLLRDAVVGDERAATLFAVEETFIDQIGDGLARRHAADAVRLAQLALGRDKVAGLPLFRADFLAQDLLELVVARHRTVAVDRPHILNSLSDRPHTSGVSVICAL